MGHVVGVVAADEVGAQPPHVRLAETDERRESAFVAHSRVERGSRECVHATHRMGRRNFSPGRHDYMCMNCEDYREEFSALLDREEPHARRRRARRPPRPMWRLHGVDDLGVADASRRPRCGRHPMSRIWSSRSSSPRRASVVRGAAGVRRRRARRASPDSLWRRSGSPNWSPPCRDCSPDGQSGTALHSVHELGSFDVALAVGFIAAALRPSLARGMLPLVVALVGALAAVTIGDVVSSHAGWARGVSPPVVGGRNPAAVAGGPPRR